MLDQGEAAHARDVDAMSDAMNPDPREPIGPEPDPVPAPLLDRPKQPHVDHVTDLGPAVGKPVRRDLRVRQERVEGALWWTQPTAVELTEEQVFTEALGADLRATMEGCAEGKVLNTFDAWWAHNGDALDAAMRMGGES